MKKIFRQRIVIIFVLIDLKREIKEDIVFVMKAKTHILNVSLKRSLFKVYVKKHKQSFQKL